jgi:hypothetical protein
MLTRIPSGNMIIITLPGMVKQILGAVEGGKKNGKKQFP